MPSSLLDIFVAPSEDFFLGTNPLPAPLRRQRLEPPPTLRNVESTAGIHGLATDTSGSRPKIQRFSYGEAAKLGGFGHGDV